MLSFRPSPPVHKSNPAQLSVIKLCKSGSRVSIRLLPCIIPAYTFEQRPCPVPWFELSFPAPEFSGAIPSYCRPFRSGPAHKVVAIGDVDNLQSAAGYRHASANRASPSPGAAVRVRRSPSLPAGLRSRHTSAACSACALRRSSRLVGSGPISWLPVRAVGVRVVGLSGRLSGHL